MGLQPVCVVSRVGKQTHIVEGTDVGNVGIEHLLRLLWLQLGAQRFALQDGHGQIGLVGLGLLADVVLDGVVRLGEGLELVAQDGIANLVQQGVDALLDVLDSVVDGHCQDALHERPALEGRGQKQIEHSAHDGSRIGDPDDVLQDSVGNERVDPLSLGKQLGRVVFGQEKVVDGGSNLDPQPFGELAILDVEVFELVLCSDFSKQLGEAV